MVKRSKSTLFGFVALVLLSTIWGFQSFSALKAGGYDDTGSESARVNTLLSQKFDQSIPEVVVIADFALGADDASSAKVGHSLARSLKAISGVNGVSSYYSTGRPSSLKSSDGKAVYFFVNLNDKISQAPVARQIEESFGGNYGSAKIYIAGSAPVTSEINSTISGDLARAESFAVPLTIILLVLVFGSLVASGLPFLVALTSMLGSLFVVWVMSQFTDTSVFSVNLITGLGLGLGIDYALLIVNRYREERALGKPVDEAVKATVTSAGRTVFFSGVTVAVVLLALGFFPQYFLRSFAIAGTSVVLFAVVGALTALPALINLLGDRVDKGRVLKSSLKQSDRGTWERLSRFVMRRPMPVLVIVLMALGGLMSLASGVQFGQVDDRILPKDNRVVTASNIIRDRFSGREGSPIEILVKTNDQSQVVNFTQKLSRLDHIVRVESVEGIAQEGTLDATAAPYFSSFKKAGWQRIVAVGDVEPRGPGGYDLTLKVRDLANNFDTYLVGGSAAVYTDSMLGISHNAPWAGLWIVLATLVLLFLFTGSVILPVKAVLLNVLSLGATLGFLSWVFMNGNLKWLIGDFAVTGTIDSSSLVLIAVMTFGLSMDYELFLLSRIKEQHESGLNTTDSVSVGLQKSGRIITAAALVLAVSFFAFTTSGVSIMKMLGLGIAFAILLDATVVRALLVPALMRLFGEANWWAPRWLRKLYEKAGLSH